MGAVYEVEHTTLGVHYALKTFTLDHGQKELFRKRFLAEGRLLARLSHPNIVRVFDLDYDLPSGLLYYVMDLVLYKDGNAYTLADIEEGSAEEELLAQWFTELCQALAFVHSHGIVHRDIKLNNILLTPERHVVLSDFGISKVLEEKLRKDVDVTNTLSTVSGSGKLIMGTKGYMAPEVLRGGEVTPAADVYSLGVVFFRLLTGVWYDPCLAPDSDRGSLTAINSVRLLENLDYNWAEILPAMLATNPAERPTNLSALPSKICRSRQNPTETRERRYLPWISVGAVAAAVLAAVLYFAVFPLLKGGETDDKMLEDAFAIPESLK